MAAQAAASMPIRRTVGIPMQYRSPGLYRATTKWSQIMNGLVRVGLFVGAIAILANMAGYKSTPSATAEDNAKAWNAVKPIDEFWKEFDAKQMNLEINSAAAALVYLDNCWPKTNSQKIVYGIAAVANKYPNGEYLVAKAAAARLKAINDQNGMGMPAFCAIAANAEAISAAPAKVPTQSQIPDDIKCLKPDDTPEPCESRK